MRYKMWTQAEESELLAALEGSRSKQSVFRRHAEAYGRSPKSVENHFYKFLLFGKPVVATEETSADPVSDTPTMFTTDDGDLFDIGQTFRDLIYRIDELAAGRERLREDVEVLTEERQLLRHIIEQQAAELTEVRDELATVYRIIERARKDELGVPSGRTYRVNSQGEVE